MYDRYSGVGLAAQKRHRRPGLFVSFPRHPVWAFVLMLRDQKWLLPTRVPRLRSRQEGGLSEPGRGRCYLLRSLESGRSVFNLIVVTKERMITSCPREPQRDEEATSCLEMVMLSKLIFHAAMFGVIFEHDVS